MTTAKATSTREGPAGGPDRAAPAFSRATEVTPHVAKPTLIGVAPRGSSADDAFPEGGRSRHRRDSHEGFVGDPWRTGFAL
jgi:hypothetical protein